MLAVAAASTATLCGTFCAIEVQMRLHQHLSGVEVMKHFIRSCSRPAVGPEPYAAGKNSEVDQLIPWSPAGEITRWGKKRKNKKIKK